MSAAEIGTAATVGKAVLQVVKLPKVAIISTGDELVEIGETPEAHQIRRSNVYAIAALLDDRFKIEADLWHFNDDEVEITEGVKNILATYDLVILSGAVSEGKYDFVPKALAINEVGTKSYFPSDTAPLKITKSCSAKIFLTPSVISASLSLKWYKLASILNLSFNKEARA